MDYGGSRREFLRLLASAAGDDYFHGLPDFKFFLLDVSAIQVGMHA